MKQLKKLKVFGLMAMLISMVIWRALVRTMIRAEGLYLMER